MEKETNTLETSYAYGRTNVYMLSPISKGTKQTQETYNQNFKFLLQNRPGYGWVTIQFKTQNLIRKIISVESKY